MARDGNPRQQSRLGWRARYRNGGSSDGTNCGDRLTREEAEEARARVGVVCKGTGRRQLSRGACCHLQMQAFHGRAGAAQWVAVAAESTKTDAQTLTRVVVEKATAVSGAVVARSCRIGQGILRLLLHALHKMHALSHGGRRRRW